MLILGPTVIAKSCGLMCKDKLYIPKGREVGDQLICGNDTQKAQEMYVRGDMVLLFDSLSFSVC